jgi:hypothetical protein
VRSNHRLLSNNVDLSISGFEMGEIDVVLGAAIDEEDALPIVNEVDPPMTKLGDLWHLGDTDWSAAMR